MLYSHSAPRRCTQLQYFPTPLRGAAHYFNIFGLCSTALRTAPVLSHPFSLRIGPLKYIPSQLLYIPTRSHIFRHRSTALRAAPILSSAPRCLAPLQFFPTPLLRYSHRSNIFPTSFVALRAVIIYSHSAPRHHVSLRPRHSRKIPPGASYTVHPVNFTPDVRTRKIHKMLHLKASLKSCSIIEISDYLKTSLKDTKHS